MASSGRPKHGWTTGDNNKKAYKKYKVARKSRLKKEKK